MSTAKTRSVECPGKPGFTNKPEDWVTCGSRYYEATIDFNDEGEMVDVWECNNCCTKTPRLHRKQRTDTISRQQANMVESIKRSGLKHDDGTVWQDVKTELTEYGTLIFTGTLANTKHTSGLFNTMVQLFIGRRGATHGTVFGSFGSKDRVIKTRRDLWMVYR